MESGLTEPSFVITRITCPNDSLAMAALNRFHILHYNIKHLVLICFISNEHQPAQRGIPIISPALHYTWISFAVIQVLRLCKTNFTVDNYSQLDVRRQIAATLLPILIVHR